MLRIIENSSYESVKSSTSVRVSPEASKINCLHILKEMQEEILLRLPVKSIRRFESVCKTWQKRIRSQGFVDLYHRRLRSLPSTLDLHTTLMEKIAPQVHDTKLSKHAVRVVGPLSNGVYCVMGCSTISDGVNFGSGNIALYNPSTNDYKLANPSPAKIAMGITNNLGFGSVQRKSPSRGLDYKAVIIESVQPFVAYVYCFRNEEWKSISDNKKLNRMVLYPPYEVCPQNFLHGCWHWKALNRDTSPSVVSFNFADEAFESIRGPVRHHDGSSFASVFVLHDHLAMIRLFHDWSSASVWVMKEYGVEDSWSKIYESQPDPCHLFSRLVGIDSRLENGGINIKKLYFEAKYSKKIVYCDDAGTKPFCTWDSYLPVVFWNTPGISTYVPSLERFTQYPSHARD